MALPQTDMAAAAGHAGPYLGRRGFYTWWWSRVVQRRAAAGTKTPSPRRRLQPRTKTHGTESRQRHSLPKLCSRIGVLLGRQQHHRFKPMTMVTTLATRGAALYIGGRRSVIRRARRGCRRVCRRGGLSAPDRITRPGLTLYSVNAVFRRECYSARVTSYQHDQHTK